MIIKYLFTILFLFTASGFIAYGQQEDENWIEQSKHPKGVIKLSVGESKTVTGNVRKGAPHFYKIQIAGHLKVQVVSDSPQAAAFAVHTFIWQGSGPERNAFSDDANRNDGKLYSVAPSSREYELEKDRDYELAVAVPERLRQANYSITVKAVPSELKAYKFFACGKTNVIRTNLVELNQNNLQMGSYMGARHYTYGGIKDNNFFFSLENAIDADLTGDGVNEKLILAECSNAFEAETGDYPKTYVLYAFDSGKDSLAPLGSWIFDMNPKESFDSKDLVFQNGKITASFQKTDSAGKERAKIFNLGWSNSKFVNFAAKSGGKEKPAGNVTKYNNSPEPAQTQRFVIAKDSTTFELKRCEVNGKELACSFSVVSSGSDVEKFYFSNSDNTIVDGDGNQISSYEGNQKSNVLVDGVPVSGTIKFKTANPKATKIARFDIKYYADGSGKNISFRNIPIFNPSSTNNSSAPAAYQDNVPVTARKQSIEKEGITFEVPEKWKPVQERSDVISLALPENIKQINNQPDMSFGIIAGATVIKPNKAQAILNSVLKEPVSNTISLDEVSKQLVKQTAKQFGYKQTGVFQNTSLAGKTAMQSRIQGISKATGKTETVLITTVLMNNEKLFYLMVVFPSDAKPEDLLIFDEIRNSVRLP